ncbi:MAG: hypothetical protein IKW88_01980 [Clostridiales bacterium]|nr:hypothetical protein [Clostridiales bacterium]
MKRSVLASAILVTLILSACSAVGKPETSASTQEAAPVATTVATTAAKAKETMITETTAPGDKPEDYADVTCINERDRKTLFATDFDFGKASLVKDNNGVRSYPNYPAGQDMVITFKSNRKFEWGEIVRSALYPQVDEHKDVYIANVEQNEKGSSSNILQFLTYKDGTYTLTIPAKYAEQDNIFSICLTTKSWYEESKMDQLYFYVCCIKDKTLTNKPTFSIEDHASVHDLGVDAKEFEFVNAEMKVSNNGHKYYCDWPKFPEGQDITVSFKSTNAIKLVRVEYYEKDKLKNGLSKGTKIPVEELLTYAEGKYTLKIPANYAVTNRLFSIEFNGVKDDGIYLSFSFEC